MRIMHINKLVENTIGLFMCLFIIVLTSCVNYLNYLLLSKFHADTWGQEILIQFQLSASVISQKDTSVVERLHVVMEVVNSIKIV